MKKITIDPVTRIEGHAKIDIYLDDSGRVADTQFHVTQVRGFEKFTEGRPFYEMPSITARICGICPVSHLLASPRRATPSWRWRRRRPAVKLRELVHCAQFVQSHALSFFHLSAPDLLLGFDSDPARRNIFGLIEENPEAGQDRRSAAQVRAGDHRRAGQGARASFLDCARRRERAARPRGARAHSGGFARRARHGADGPSHSSRRWWTSFRRRSPISDRAHRCTPEWWTRIGGFSGTTGGCKFKDAGGATVAPGIRARDYARYIGEASLNDSYLKAPYLQAASATRPDLSRRACWRG